MQIPSPVIAPPQRDDASSTGDEEMTELEEADPIEDLPSDAQVTYDVARAAKREIDLANQARYRQERAGCQGTVVPIEYKKDNTVVEWKVQDVQAEELEKRVEIKDEDIGLTDFDFSQLTVRDCRGRFSRVNFMKIFFAVWPGNIKHQLLMLNRMIEEDNKSRRKGMVLPISLREFAVFIGIMTAARCEGKQGLSLWQGSTEDGEGYRSQVDMSRWMAKYRHSQIRKYFSFIFADPTTKDTDPWWMVTAGVKAFNHNRQTLIRSSDSVIIDEAMSAYRPREKATGK